jgi:effector-binding domain-containing protein
VPTGNANIGAAALPIPSSASVFEIVSEKKIPLRDDYCIEHYANDPRTTPEEQLVTEILIPTV